MNLFQIVKMALGEIKSNKLRSFLTMLGIAIGTASVILFVTISIGSRQSINKSMESKPLDLITTSIYSQDRKITEGDIIQLKRMSEIKEISPEISKSSVVSYNKKDENQNIVGTDWKFIQLNGGKLDKGRFIMPVDNDLSTKVIVLGSSVSKKLFPKEDPIGKVVIINAIPYKVVGVLAPYGDSYESTEDISIYMPYKTAQIDLGISDIGKLNIQVKSVDNIRKAMLEINNHFTSKGINQRDLDVRSNKEMIDAQKSMDATMNLMVGAIASVSLFVAGIGIMNMMLVSVTERTKEIGIRKALGSPRKFILIQFLVESLTISFIGGFIGATIGIFGSFPILKSMNADSYIAWNVVFASVGFAVLMGVIFGISPANKASKLQPIVALKSE
ncbi:ABC transporter permease [Romboutsia weinsteinii]|uniref:ABC transporter permease n=1 Tax=Romboutsia weinsteinii TaxID=2020949 RepID=A0A255HHS1_9FIRM|nr:ABC transporter permease [Romboutsia weinsteinii]RDY26290.1 ABC transporter permease [Romboutsia weinsteinii]